MLPFLTEEQAISFILILSRVSGIFIAAPIFDAKYIPAKFKILFALIVSLILYPSIHPIAEPPKTIQTLFILSSGQMIFGFFLGSCISFIFAGLQEAGSLMDIQIGFSMSTIMDPFTRNPVTLIARWYYFLAGMVFFAIDGHHWLFLGLINSFKAVPLDQFILSPKFIEFYIRSFSNILIIAFHVAIPIVSAVILVDVIMGFVARIAPQMNILIIGFPFKIAMGFFILMSITPSIMIFFQKYFNGLQEPLLRMFYM